MNYATQHHIGNNPIPRTETTKTTAPTISRVRTLVAKTKNSERSAERQTKICTDNNVTNGFLKSTFLPKMREKQTFEDFRKTAKTERDFYKSLSQIADHYSIEPMPTKNFEFPYNLELAMWDLQTKLQCKQTNFDSFKLLQNSKKTYFVSEEKYNTGTTLYYIPVIPIFKMLHDKKRKKNAQLLLSVCSYLYHISQVPYYREEETYLYWLYVMHKDWVFSDYENEETEMCKHELRTAEIIGDKMEKKIKNRINLEVFQQRLKGFKCRDRFDNECWEIACNAFALFSEFPLTSIFRNAPFFGQNPYDDETETIGMEKYISFVSDTKNWLYESLLESINNEFNECGTMEEPTVFKVFDGGNLTQDDLDFENRIFNVLDELSALLYHYQPII